MRRRAAVDANQASIIAAMRQAGASVQPLHAVGKGCPDLLVGICTNAGRRCYVVEIKDGSKPPSARKLTPAQVEWHAAWRGGVHVITDVDQAVAWVQSMMA